MSFLLLTSEKKTKTKLDDISNRRLALGLVVHAILEDIRAWNNAVMWNNDEKKEEENQRKIFLMCSLFSVDYTGNPNDIYTEKMAEIFVRMKKINIKTKT